MIRKFFVYLLAMSLIMFLSHAFASEPIEEWVKRHDGGGSPIEPSLKVDSSGNVYVAGEYGGDYVIRKFDTNGNELWVKRYDGGEYDRAVALAIDSSGNVYVTGSTRSNPRPYVYVWAIATLKYDANGNELWVKKYQGFNYATVRAIAVDSLGNVYITGGSDDRFNTIKYDTNGNELWVKNHAVSLYGAYALAVDSLGNVYVTGGTGGRDPFDCTTIKYDTNGNELWVKKYDGGYGDSGKALALDSRGNVLVTGWSLSSGGYNTDYFTVKYDANGNELWVKRYDYAYDSPLAITVDSSANVYVTGLSGSGYYDYTTIKYDVNGNELWVKRYDSGGWDIPLAIVVDSLDNIYITGDGNGDYATLKYDTDGNELWVKRYDSGGYDRATKLVVDSLGNVYITGLSGPDRNNLGYVTIKYRQAVLTPSSGLTASDTPCDNGGSVTLSWTLSPDDRSKVTGYRVYRSTTSGGPYELIGSVNAGVGSYADTSAVTGTTYYYVVRATDGTNESVNSNEVSALSFRNLPLPPANVTATDTPYDLGGSISLSWAKSTDDGAGLKNVLSYNIYRYSSTNGNIVSLASVPAGTVSYVDATTVDTDIYYYFLKAMDKNCSIESSASSIASGQSANNLTSLPDFISTLPGIAPELVNSLTSKVENAIASLDRGNETAAINQLNALLSEIAAQTGNKIEASTAEILTNYVQNLINYIKSN